MHFYTEHTKFGEETGRFSDGGENSFLVTSLFCLSEDAKAFACQKGQIIVVPNAESNALVNVILKPIDNLDIRFSNVEYYVYRGIRKDSILQSDTEMLEPSGTATDLIDRIYSEADFDGAYSANMVGYSNDLTDEITIDSLFYDMDIKKMLVLEGEWFGTFNSDTSIGFEIVVDTEMCPLTVGILKQNSYSIVSFGTTDFERRMSRERILAFIDPVAFWGMHSKVGVQVAGQSHKIKKTDLGTTILSHYNNKSRVYIDIRSEWGYSYNVYGTYTDTLGNSIQVGTDKNSLIARTYETNGWPILWESELEDAEKLYIRLKMPQSQKPILHLDNKEQLGYKINLGDIPLMERGNTEWTRSIPLCLRYGNGEDMYSQIFCAFYVDRDAIYTIRPFGAIDKTERRLNGKINFLFDNKLLYRRSQMDEEQYEQVSESGANWDDERIVFYTKSVQRHNWSNTMLKPSEESDCEGFTLNGTSNLVSFLHNSLDIAIDTIFESSQQIPIINLIGHREFFTFRGDVSCLCLTREIFKTLKNLTGFCTFHIRKIGFEEMTTENDEYKKFKLFVKGYDTAGNYVEQYPEEPVIVYSTPDELILADKEFAEVELQKRENNLYKANYEERAGRKTMPTLLYDEFINPCGTIKNEVEEFKRKLTELPSDHTAIRFVRNLVEEHASNLWEHAKQYVQGVKQNDGTYIGGINDDRPLYWARLMMEYELKSMGCFKGQVKGSKVKRFTRLERLIRLFEEKSRNYMGINFSDAPVGAKKILITGFDPFDLDYNPAQNNPSGIIALALHGRTIEYKPNETSPTAIGYIQSMIFPVRYEDFDKGYVERYIYPHLHEVDMIVTISQGRYRYYDIERFAGVWRSEWLSDNMQIKGQKAKHYKVNGLPLNKLILTPSINVPPYLETTLPFGYMFEKGREFEIAVIFNQYLNMVGIETPIIEKGISDDDCNLKTIDKEIHRRDKIIGSGGDFLSNEIFYRVSLLRCSHNPTLKSGHLHVPKLDDTFYIEKVLSETTKLLEYALKKL